MTQDNENSGNQRVNSPDRNGESAGRPGSEEMQSGDMLEFYQLILSESPVGMAIFDGDSGQCVAANRAIARFLKAGLDQVLAQNFNDLASWKTSGLLDQARIALQEESETRLEADLTTSFGEHVTIECRFAPFSARKQKYLLVTLVDISERREAEEALRESRKQYELLFDEMPDGFALCEVICDENGVPVDMRYLELNSAFEKLTGLARSDTLGRTALEVMPEFELSWIERYGAVATTGEPFEADRYSKTLQRHYRVKAFRPRDRQVAVLFSDITRSKLADEELRNVLEFKEKILSEAPVGIAIYDADSGQCVAANRSIASLVGTSEETVLAQNIYDIESWKTSGLFDAAMSALRNGVKESLEANVITSFGKHLMIECCFAPFAIGEKRYLILTADDITERKRAEQERLVLEAKTRHAQKLESLGVLAGGIAHDFNNLLVGVLGNTDLALVDLPATSPARASVEKVQLAATRAADLADQMLAYTGKGQFSIKTINLSELVREMRELLGSSVAKTTILEYQLLDEIAPIEADTTQLHQVVLNLVTNGSEALQEEAGVLTVVTGTMECDEAYLSAFCVSGDCREGTYAFLEVSDTGVGMDQGAIERMFEPFFTTKFTGRGLGLATVFGIVSGHGGGIEVESEKGRGTRIRVLFPTTETPVESPEVELRVTSETIDGGTVLLIDDEPMVLDVGERMLQRAGYEVLLARDGVEGVEQFREHSSDVDCVILDLTMPIMGGEETLSELRRISGTVPVILASGYSLIDIEARLSTMGVSGFIKKPYRIEKLRRVLSDVLSE